MEIQKRSPENVEEALLQLQGGAQRRHARAPAFHKATSPQPPFTSSAPPDQQPGHGGREQQPGRGLVEGRGHAAGSQAHPRAKSMPRQANTTRYHQICQTIEDSAKNQRRGQRQKIVPGKMMRQPKKWNHSGVETSGSPPRCQVAGIKNTARKYSTPSPPRDYHKWNSTALPYCPPRLVTMQRFMQKAERGPRSSPERHYSESAERKPAKKLKAGPTARKQNGQQLSPIAQSSAGAGMALCGNSAIPTSSHCSRCRLARHWYFAMVAKIQLQPRGG